MIHVDPVSTYAASNPDRFAIVDLESGRRWTYAQLNAAADRLAAWLVGEFGPASAVRVATLARNCAEMPILQLASARAGTIFVPLNWRLAAPEIEALIEDASPGIVFHEPEFPAPRAASRSGVIGGLLELGHSGARAPAGSRRPLQEVSTLLYTSGTSGRPKGVMLSELNAFWGCANFIYGNAVSLHSVFLCDMPLFHTAGLYAATRTPLQAGGCVLISRGFDVGKTLQRLTDPTLKVSHYFSVPQMATRLWTEPGFEPHKLRGLQAWAIGGAPNPKAQTERFVAAGIRIVEGFGMSETGSNFGMPPHDLEVLQRKAGSCGLPFMSIEARIVDDHGRDVPPGTTGELWMRGPSIASGYWQQPEATAKAFRDGWFVTGDAAVRDADGFYYEAAICELPSVAECAVVGVPDPQWGEVGRVYVIAAPGHALTPEQIIAHCRNRLARFKVPKSVAVTDAVPRTASGKVQKHLLRQRALAELGTP